MRASCLLLLLTPLACGEAGPVDRTLVLSEDYLHFTALGDSVVLHALWHDAGGAVIDTAQVLWESRDVQVIHARSNGTVVARGNGSTIVRARVEGVVDSVWVGVAQVATAVTVAPATAAFTAALDSAVFTGTVWDANGSPILGATVSWSVIDQRVALVDTLRGIVRAIDDGTTEVVARAGGLTATAQVTVQRVPTSVAASAAAAYVAVGDSVALTAVVSDRNGAPMPNAVVSWAPVITSEVAVSASGRAIPLAPGALKTVAVQAFAGGASGVVTFNVLKPEVWRQVVARDSRTCGVTQDSTMYCWGANTGFPVPIPHAVRFASVALGESYQCGIVGGGGLVCWGLNNYGQLGLGDLNYRSSPQGVPGGPWLAVSTGQAHTCAIRAADSVAFCWGAGAHGRLGNGMYVTAVTSPDSVRTDQRFATVSAGGEHSCGTTASGTAFCWGAKGFGQLGDGTNEWDWTFAVVQVIPTGTYTDVRAGYRHTCAVGGTGVGYCWGWSANGRLGRPTSVTDYATPQPITGGHVLQQVAAGAGHSCGVDGAGSIWCWGVGTNGELGHPGLGSTNETPRLVPGGHTFEEVALGSSFSCGRTVAGDIYCWGGGGNGAAEPRRVSGVWK